MMSFYFLHEFPPIPPSFLALFSTHLLAYPLNSLNLYLEFTLSFYTFLLLLLYCLYF